jgi:phage terminase large subunit
MLDTRWELSEDRYAMGLSADTADQFQGFHSPSMFIVVDEAEGVSDEIYEAIESVMTSAETSRLLLIGNPTTVAGAFRRAFYEERHLYHTVTISALESPNVQAGKVVIPGLTTAAWVQERQETWGQENPLYRARALGEFPDQGDDTLIKLSDIEAASRSGISGSSPLEQKAVGAGFRPAPMEEEQISVSVLVSDDVVIAVDVARFGSDRSVILRRRGCRVEEIRTFQGMDTMQLAGGVAAAIQESQPDQVYIDEVGVGAGVVDRLREQGYQVRGINVARTARQSNLFANLRAEGYWRLRDLFTAGQISIPSDNQLMGELVALRYSYDSQGRILMESKEDIRQRGLPSPDRADALMLAFLELSARARLWT